MSAEPSTKAAEFPEQGQHCPDFPKAQHHIDGWTQTGISAGRSVVLIPPEVGDRRSFGSYQEPLVFPYSMTHFYRLWGNSVLICSIWLGQSQAEMLLRKALLQRCLQKESTEGDPWSSWYSKCSSNEDTAHQMGQGRGYGRALAVLLSDSCASYTEGIWRVWTFEVLLLFLLRNYSIYTFLKQQQLGTCLHLWSTSNLNKVKHWADFGGTVGCSSFVTPQHAAYHPQFSTEGNWDSSLWILLWMPKQAVCAPSCT